MFHALIAFIIAILLVIVHAPMTAYLFVPAFYIGREIAQAEYRYIESHGGCRAACPKFCGFYVSAWTLKSLTDWLLPLMLSLAVWAVQEWTPLLKMLQNLV